MKTRKRSFLVPLNLGPEMFFFPAVPANPTKKIIITPITTIKKLPRTANTPPKARISVLVHSFLLRQRGHLVSAVSAS